MIMGSHVRVGLSQLDEDRHQTDYVDDLRLVG
jgi:hypothetical protein